MMKLIRLLLNYFVPDSLYFRKERKNLKNQNFVGAE